MSFTFLVAPMTGPGPPLAPPRERAQQHHLAAAAEPASANNMTNNIQQVSRQ